MIKTIGTPPPPHSMMHAHTLPVWITSWTVPMEWSGGVEYWNVTFLEENSLGSLYNYLLPQAHVQQGRDQHNACSYPF